jgi:hypothetical protein
MAGVESLGALALIESVLTGDVTFMAAVPGGVHLGVGPQGTLVPVCTLWVQSAPDYLTYNGTRIWSDGTLMVKLSGPTPIGALQTAADRADVLLTRRVGAAAGHTVIACVRQNAFLLAERQLVNGVQWVSIIQLFRTLVV